MATWGAASTWATFENWGVLDLPYEAQAGTRQPATAVKGTR